MISDTIGKFDNVRLHIEYIDVTRLLSGYRQTKKHSARQLKKLATGLERHGFIVPILVDEALNIVAGHARLDAAKMIGMASVPIIRIAHLTSEQLRLFKIFDNKVATEGEFDLDAVRLEFEELTFEMPDLSMSDSGFEIGEIDAMYGLHRTHELDDLDEVPEPATNPVTRLGDVWCLGVHRIIYGDSTNPANIERIVAGRPVRALVVDAPYNLEIPGVVSGKGRIKHQNFEMASGEMSPPEFTTFLASFFDAAKPSLVSGAMILAFMDWRHIVELIVAGGKADFVYRQLLVWAKSSPTMGAIWRNGHELVGVFKHGDGPSVDNVQLGRFGRNRSNVMHYPVPMCPQRGDAARSRVIQR